MVSHLLLSFKHSFDTFMIVLFTHLHISYVCPFLSSTLKCSQLSNNGLITLSIFQSILFKCVLTLLYRRQVLSIARINIGFACTSNIFSPPRGVHCDNIRKQRAGKYRVIYIQKRKKLRIFLEVK